MREMIEVWEPKWKTREVLIACHKVSRGRNLIKFTKTKSLPYVYELDGDDIMDCPVVSNGRIECYAVPISYLKIAKIKGQPEAPVTEQQQILQPAT
jgi:hypothetical protein